MMMITLTRRAAAMVLCGLAGGLIGLAAQTPGTRTIFVSAIDKKGAPVTDLTAADFAIKEDGQTREIVTAAITPLPLQVALLIDDTGVGSQAIKQGVDAFSAALKEKAAIEVTTWHRSNASTLGFASAGEESSDGVKPVYSSGGGAVHLLQRFMDASQAFEQRKADHPAIVAITSAGEEAGNVRLQDLSASLARTNAQLYVIEVATPLVSAGIDGRADASAPTLGGRLDLGDAPERSGGRVDHDVSLNNLPAVLERLAAELGSQYVVEYRTAPGKADAKLAVDTRRGGVKLRAPTRVPR
jgi:VWFA-related protein